MTPSDQLPLFPNSKTHFEQAGRWAQRITSYPQKERKQVAGFIVKHILLGIRSKQ